MDEISEERRLFREAADLAIRLQNDSENPVSVEMVRAWIGRSPAHERAWSKVAAIHGMTGKILTDRKKASQSEEPGLTRRNLMFAGAIGLGAASTATLVLPDVLLGARADYVTAKAELKSIPLVDGSTVTLGPDSAIALAFTHERRTIHLLTGMAYFDVASDKARPFVVEAGTLAATALGTAFDVSNDASIISVSVDHGLVGVNAPGLPSNDADKLNGGEWLSFDPATRSSSRGSRDGFQIAAWRTGMIVSDQETVAALVARIARWQSGKVVIADSSLGAQVVSGVFDLSDPLRALNAVVRPFGARVRQIGPFLTIISPV